MVDIVTTKVKSMLISNTSTLPDIFTRVKSNATSLMTGSTENGGSSELTTYTSDTTFYRSSSVKSSTASSSIFHINSSKKLNSEFVDLPIHHRSHESEWSTIDPYDSNTGIRTGVILSALL